MFLLDPGKLDRRMSDAVALQIEAELAALPEP